MYTLRYSKRNDPLNKNLKEELSGNYQGTEEDMEIKKVISQTKSQLESYEIEFRQSPGKKNQEIETENMNNMKHS